MTTHDNKMPIASAKSNLGMERVDMRAVDEQRRRPTASHQLLSGEQRRKRRKHLRETLKPSEISPTVSGHLNVASLGSNKLILGGLCFLVGLWAYWPTIADLVSTWNREPDYSHGYLVAPLAVGFLW